MAAEAGGALDRAIDLFRRGDSAGARREAEAGLAGGREDGRLLHFLGTLACRTGALDEGVRWFERALAADPADAGSRVNLVKALIALERIDEALAQSQAPERGGHVELDRLRGHLLQNAGRHREAAAAYETVVALHPGDWEIWNNLGNSRRTLGDLPGAVAALERAASLRGDVAPIQANLGGALAEAGEAEAALAAFERAFALAPNEPALALETARLLRHLGRDEEALARLDQAGNSPAALVERGRALSALRRLDEGEQAYRAALRLNPRDAEAWLELGILVERAGRAADLPELVAEARGAGLSEDALAYLDALTLERGGRTDEALARLERAPPALQPERTQRLKARLADRAGRPAEAFAAAAEANRIAAAAAPDSAERAATYRARIADMTATVTAEWLASWTVAPPQAARDAPAFLVGFPRSGTTLLDTMLMGHPRVHLLEEVPLLDAVMGEVGPLERLADLEADEVARLRSVYFAGMDEAAPPPAGALVVDKLPLNILAAPLIHRLFPGAPIILALRHPCDAVLSGFMQSFEINPAMANFLDLGDAARLYDSVMTHWQRCRDLLPLQVHESRYEALVAEPEATLRPLLRFLGLDWDGGVLAHDRTAAARGTISTPSYRQVTEPVHGRASGRWRGYRDQLAPVLPILLPWAERLGYSD